MISSELNSTFAETNWRVVAVDIREIRFYAKWVWNETSETIELRYTYEAHVMLPLLFPEPDTILIMSTSENASYVSRLVLCISAILDTRISLKIMTRYSRFPLTPTALFYFPAKHVVWGSTEHYESLDSQWKGPGYNSICCSFEVWIISFTPCCVTLFRCINECMAKYSGGYMWSIINIIIATVMGGT